MVLWELHLLLLTSGQLGGLSCLCCSCRPTQSNVILQSHIISEFTGEVITYLLGEIAELLRARELVVHLELLQVRWPHAVVLLCLVLFSLGASCLTCTLVLLLVA